MHNPNLDENEVLRDVLSGLNEDVPPMPEGLHAAWMQQVEQAAEEKRTDRSLNSRAMTRFLSIAAALTFVVGGTLLTRDDLADRAASDAEYASLVTQNNAMVFSANTESQYTTQLGMYDAAFPEETGAVTYKARSAAAPEAAPAAGAGVLTTGTTSDAVAVSEVPAGRHIIRTASLNIVTPGYDLSLTNLRAMCEAEGGWVEHSSEWVDSSGVRHASLTLRIPQESLDGYLAGTEDCGRITGRSETATDVTASRQDTQTRLNTQLALMDRLQAMVPQAETLPDLLALEEKIADTQYNIDVLTASLADTDQQVAYATVTISLHEELTPDITDTTLSLGDRLRSGLQLGWEAIVSFAQDALVFLVAALPFIGVVAALAVILFIIRKAGRRKKE